VTALRARRRVWIVAALAVTFLAVAFRCWRLFTVPPGLYIDEVLTARNALAWRLDPHAGLFGSRPLLTPGWVETQNLYLALASALMGLGGDGPLGIRLVSVVPSLAAVPLIYWLAAQLSDRRTGLLAAFFLACSHWAVRSGRTGWDAVLMVTLQLAALACLVHAQRRDRIAFAIAGGALVGLSLYTYVAARLVLLHAVVWLAWEGRALSPRPSSEASSPDRFGRVLARVIAFLASVLVIAIPLRRQLENASPSIRVTQLSVFSHDHPIQAIFENLLGHALMFNVRGGTYARDALPGFPMLDPLTGALFLVGLVAVALHAADAGLRFRLLLTWPAFMVLGGVLSTSGEGPPYPYRVLALAPWACLAAAIGGVALWDATRNRFTRPTRVGIATIALLAVLAVNAWVLFIAGPRDPGTRHVYGTVPTRLGLWLAEHAQGRPVVILPGVLTTPPLPPGYRYASANPMNFFRPLDDLTAVHLAAGFYRRRPERSLDPLRPAGDIDLLPELPGTLTRPTLLVVPPSQERETARRYRIDRRVELRDDHDPSRSRLAIILLARP
jgi:4-amino-4-deoxy-L-arabinose transferase-like glycosyltransferase